MSAFGDGGFGLYREWAMSSIKFDETEFRSKWASIKPTGGITIATLFAIARDRGWRDERRFRSFDPFPVDALGSAMAPAAHAFQARTQAPIDICANAVLAVAGLATQAHADVELPTGEVKPLVLYLVSIARSGERKTSTDSLALAPVKEHESELRREHVTAVVTHENEKAAWEAERKIIVGNKKLDLGARKAALDKLGPERKAPLYPIIVCHEPTFEGLAKLLANGQPSVGIFASEGGLFIGGHGFTEEAKLRTAAGLSLLWDEGRLTRVRATDGAIALAGRRVALHLQAQPDVAARLFSDPILADQGLLSRICVIAPNTRQGQRLWKEVTKEHNIAPHAYVTRLQSLFQRPMPLKEGSRNELAPPALRLSQDARRRWIQFADEVERRLAPSGDLEPISGFAAKLPEHASRIAGVITKFHDADAVEISDEMLSNGIAISRHYATTALRLHGASRINAELLDAQTLLEWMRQKSDKGLVSLPDVVQTGPNRIRETTTARRLIEILVQHRYLERLEGSATVHGNTRRDVWRLLGGSDA